MKFSKRELILLFLVILVAAYFRLYRLSEYMTFLGDEGRDAIVVRRLIVDFDPILVGPGTSIGNMYLGPLYYYMMAPFLLLAGLNPVGPAAMVALLGVATVAFVWYVGREFFGAKAGLIAAGLYAIAPTVIIFSRSSWNPNIMPFFALLSVYSIWRVWQHLEFKWLIVLGISFAFALQSHYLGLLLAPTLGLFWLLALLKVRKTKHAKHYIRYTIYAAAIFVFLMSPLVIFDARHGWRNFDAMKKFFLERQTTVSARPWNALPEAWPQLQKISTRLVAGRNEFLGPWVALGLSSVLLIVAKAKRTELFKREYAAYILLIIWLGSALLGLGLYKQEIYDHYYGFFFAVPFLLLGGISQHLIDGHKLRGWWLVLTALVFLVYFNLAESPLKNPPNRQLQRTEEVAEKILSESGGGRFNLAVIAERNYEDAYQYFLERWGAKVLDIDSQIIDETVTDQLFVVCELPPEKCDPTHSPKAEVANFGWSKIDQEWSVTGVTLYKLSHSQ